MLIIVLQRPIADHRQSRSAGRRLLFLLLRTVIGQVVPLVAHLARAAPGVDAVRVEGAVAGEVAGLSTDEADGIGQLAAVCGPATLGEAVFSGAAAETQARHGSLDAGDAVGTVADKVARLTAPQTHLKAGDGRG